MPAGALETRLLTRWDGLYASGPMTNRWQMIKAWPPEPAIRPSTCCYAS